MENKLDNYYELGRRAKDSKDFKLAANYYKEILINNPKDWEASFYVGLGDAASCTLAQLEMAVRKIETAFDTGLKLLNVQDVEASSKAIVEMSGNTIKILESFKNIVDNHYAQFSSLPGSNSEYISHATKIRFCAKNCGGKVERLFNPELKKLCVDLLEFYINDLFLYDILYCGGSGGFKSTVSYEAMTIKKYKPDYVNPFEAMGGKKSTGTSSGGCYVATCVYGSYDCPEVWTLRRYRDYTLAETWCGRAFIKTYYAISPTLVKWFGETEWFKKLWKGKLDKMVSNLQKNGVESTPYEDKNW